MEMESGESFSNIGFQTRYNTVTQWPHFVPHDERLPCRKSPIPNFDATVSSVQSNNNCIVAAGENENDLNHSGLYSNKTVMVIIIKIYDRAKFLPVTTCKQNPS
jgi:hypothetical protein